MVHFVHLSHLICLGVFLLGAVACQSSEVAPQNPPKVVVESNTEKTDQTESVAATKVVAKGEAGNQDAPEKNQPPRVATKQKPQKKGWWNQSKGASQKAEGSGQEMASLEGLEIERGTDGKIVMTDELEERLQKMFEQAQNNPEFKDMKPGQRLTLGFKDRGETHWEKWTKKMNISTIDGHKCQEILDEEIQVLQLIVEEQVKLGTLTPRTKKVVLPTLVDQVKTEFDERFEKLLNNPAAMADLNHLYRDRPVLHFLPKGVQVVGRHKYQNMNLGFHAVPQKKAGEQPAKEGE